MGQAALVVAGLMAFALTGSATEDPMLRQRRGQCNSSLRVRSCSRMAASLRAFQTEQSGGRMPAFLEVNAEMAYHDYFPTCPVGG